MCTRCLAVEYKFSYNLVHSAVYLLRFSCHLSIQVSDSRLTHPGRISLTWTVNLSILKITIALDRLRWYEKVVRHFYRPQTKFAKVMSCLSVILHRGGLHVGGGLHPGRDWTDLPPSDTTGYSQRAGGTHHTRNAFLLKIIFPTFQLKFNIPIHFRKSLAH